MKAQLCRDDDGDYVICPLLSVKPVKRRGEWEQRNRNDDRLDIVMFGGDFKRLFPRLKLKPGEGPRRIEIVAEFVD